MSKSEAELIELAEQVKHMSDIACPLCGEAGFDVPGYVFSHEHWCKVRNACLLGLANNNEEVAAALKARAHD